MSIRNINNYIEDNSWFKIMILTTRSAVHLPVCLTRPTQSVPILAYHWIVALFTIFHEVLLYLDSSYLYFYINSLVLQWFSPYYVAYILFNSSANDFSFQSYGIDPISIYNSLSSYNPSINTFNIFDFSYSILYFIDVIY